jgi:dihydrofolate synthase / folylpolyglutamate synthase
LTLEELLPWLFGRTTGGIRWGLDRTERLLESVGNPHSSFHSLHIGGTNGKGSVAALCASVLRQMPGRRVGLYTSPHLVSFAERIRIDGVPVDEALLLRVADRLRAEADASGASFFEATTAIAFGCFEAAGVDIAVVEVGLGGRMDATNVLRPLAVAVTNVDREHTEFLGNTLPEIAREKAGILKAGVPAVTAEQKPEVLEVLRSSAEAVAAPLHLLDEVVSFGRVTRGRRGSSLTLRSRRWGALQLDVALPGSFQARNAVLAAELLGVLPPELRPSVGELQQGFARARWPGRLQVIESRGTTWLLDVAHNPAGIDALCQALDELALPRPWVIVAGILADKEWHAMLPPLLDRADAGILTIPTSAPSSRRWDPAHAAEQLQPGFPRTRAIPELSRALDRAVTTAPYGTVIVTGSIHTVGDALAHLGCSVES